MLMKVYLGAFFLFVNSMFCVSQGTSDSLVTYADLKFHSGFERKAVQNYIAYKKDTFNLFLAIDPDIDSAEVDRYRKSYLSTLEDLKKKNTDSKKIKKRIKIAFNTVHDNCLKKYNEIEYFPVLFKNGTYNCVSSSMLYALIFDDLKISYKLKANTNHVYLIANPGPKSVVIETTNPNLQRKEFVSDYKKQYVNSLKSLKVISEDEYKNKSVNELFEENMNSVSVAQFDYLVGYQYYNKGLQKFRKKELEKSYRLLQKAYFFYPSKQVRYVIYPVLVQLIKKNSFKKVSDIDYLAQLSRYTELNSSMIISVLSNIVNHNLQFTDKEQFCDSIFERLIVQVKNKALQEDLSFSFNLRMSKHFKKTDKQENYISNAILIKQNHREANELFESYLSRKFKRIYKYESKLDSLKSFKNKYNYAFIEPLLYEQELLAHIEKAYELFSYNKIDEGEVYLSLFEKKTVLPVESENKDFIRSIETTYRTLAIYYFYRNQKQKAIQTVERGLKYIPGSRYIQTAVYD